MKIISEVKQMDNVIIIGAGRLGRSIARSLNNKADVTIIDKNKDKLAKFEDYSGFTEVGDATDLHLLEKSGIEKADQVIIMTDDDNINVFLADLCSYKYHVPKIYTRLKDSRNKKLVSDKVVCICPFELTLDYFEENNEGDKA